MYYSSIILSNAINGWHVFNQWNWITFRILIKSQSSKYLAVWASLFKYFLFIFLTRREPQNPTRIYEKIVHVLVKCLTYYQSQYIRNISRANNIYYVLITNKRTKAIKNNIFFKCNIFLEKKILTYVHGMWPFYPHKKRVNNCDFRAPEQ